MHRCVFVGDIVMLRDPQNPERELVRRVAALEGEEMESSDSDDEPFRLAPGTCWVLCDNEKLSPKVPVWTYWPRWHLGVELSCILTIRLCASDSEIMRCTKLALPAIEKDEP